VYATITIVVRDVNVALRGKQEKKLENNVYYHVLGVNEYILYIGYFLLTINYINSTHFL